ncbi:MAG: transcription antitermination factor NusB [Patescibacteria group bacterium]
MSNRHAARMVVLQILYQWDFRSGAGIPLAELVANMKAEFGEGLEDNGYIDGQLHGVLAHTSALDELIAHFAPNWTVESMTLIDRNTLRLGLYELVFDALIPSVVAINEAIELGKAFGGEASGKFVNGVLGGIYKDRQERGIVKEIDQIMAAKRAQKEQAFKER